MIAKNKKNAAGAAPISYRHEASMQRDPAAVVVDIRAAGRTEQKQSISPAAEGLRLVQAFLKIPDPIKRAELIRMVEDYVRGAQR